MVQLLPLAMAFPRPDSTAPVVPAIAILPNRSVTKGGLRNSRERCRSQAWSVQRPPGRSSAGSHPGIREN
jgi:hypothetical protein